MGAEQERTADERISLWAWNVHCLLQAKPGAMVAVKSATGKATTIFSGRLEFFEKRVPEIKMRTEDGTIRTADLRDVMACIHSSERVSAREAADRIATALLEYSSSGPVVVNDSGGGGKVKEGTPPEKEFQTPAQVEDDIARRTGAMLARHLHGLRLTTAQASLRYAETLIQCRLRVDAESPEFLEVAQRLEAYYESPLIERVFGKL